MSKGSRNLTFGTKTSMGKHRRSGVAHNHAISIQKTREYNRQVEEEIAMKEKRKPEMFSKVRDLLKD